MLKIGLVGVGGISGAHIPAWNAMEDTAFLVKIHRVPFYFSVTEMLIVRDAPSSSPWKNACISPSLPTCSRKSA